MKLKLLLAVCLSVLLLNSCQRDQSNSASLGRPVKATGQISTAQVVNQIVEAACGECQFDMEGTSCDLAVRIDGKAYFVDGSFIDGHGDAHGNDGLCNCIRQAKVSGELKDGRFVSTSFDLLPANNPKNTVKKDGIEKLDR